VINAPKSVPLLPKKYLIPRAQDFEISLADGLDRDRYCFVGFHEYAPQLVMKRY
jgi:hypothetical protein